ncbi:hypothetical protein GIB67_021461 [Kingdonia uniflora]|uniref:Zinc-hook domain-containing protein n=1 Tax=Kingdonia uniflora TaxID=39325 RepID=A0A7J7NTW0_9MAGN|nr:hypothetical protein GIB67_021461 [Kingdonia uniflora]
MEMDDIGEIKKSKIDVIGNSNLEIGKLQQAADEHMSLRHDRDCTIQNIFLKHNLGCLPPTPFSNEVTFNLMNQVKTRLTDLENDLKDKKKSNATELQSIWDSYVAANQRYSDLEGQKHAEAKRKADVLRCMKEKEKERDMAELQLSNFNLSHIDEKEKTLHMEIERKTRQMAEKQFEENIQKKKIELFSLTQKYNALSREKDGMTSDSEYRVKLDLKKGEIDSRRKHHKKMQVVRYLFLLLVYLLDEYREKIRSVLKGRFPIEKDLKREIDQALGALKKEYDDLTSKSVEAEKEMKVAQVKIQDVKNTLLKFQKDMDARKRFIESKLQYFAHQPLNIESFPEVLHETLENRDVQKSKYNIADGMRQMFDPFERVARAHHVCPCCERPFSPAEEDEFVKKQRVKSSSSAEHMKLLAVESSNAESHFQQLDKLRMAYEEYLKLGNETIPLAEKNIIAFTEDLDQKSQAHDDVLGVLAQIKIEKELAEETVKPVESADRLLHEMGDLQDEVDDLESRLDVRGQGVKTLEELQSHLNTLHSMKDNLTNDVQKLYEEQSDMNDDLKNIQLRWQTSREDKSDASKIIDKVKKAEDDLNNLAVEADQLDFNEKHLVEGLGTLHKEKEKFLCHHRELTIILGKQLEEQDEFKREYQKKVETLEENTLKIKEYNDSKKGEKLKESQEKQSLYKSQLQNCESREQEISAELNKSKELKLTQDQLKRNIDDNLNYRKTKAEVDELMRDIESLEDRILKVGEVSTFEADLRKLVQERERFRSELDRCHGTLSVYQSNISKHKIDLKQTQYNDIDKRYFNQLIQLKTTEMANKDLDRYYNALDKALQRFHTMKMEEINTIIRELWQQTYRGQDIDCISIRSDSEGAGTRSYSYRVLMQTGDAELEMRGRCSAGQKVLASLIIRLALAETFCLNCGILALDEPTTNLDGPNAESLAAALLRIMEDRKGQENFQLIVITHDERFAQLIGQRQHAERYYRVTKDEHQHSIIEAQEIFD